jgi:pyridinium-3,5-bisthiocarboxylic acid mononucleotide nickel chelatase
LVNTLHVLTNPLHVELLLDRIYQLVPTLGVRAFSVSKHALDRVWRDIDLPDGRARIKLGVHKGRIVSATPEFDDIAQLSQKTGIAVRVLLDLCSTEASSLGLRPGAVLNEI